MVDFTRINAEKSDYIKYYVMSGNRYRNNQLRVIDNEYGGL